MWATVAAFCAAAFSFVNVVAGVRMSSRASQSQWRRSAALESIALILKDVDVFVAKAEKLAIAMDLGSDQISVETGSLTNWQTLHSELWKCHAELLLRICEVEIVASPTTVEKAHSLSIALGIVGHQLRAGGSSEKVSILFASATMITAARKEFVLAARQEVGSTSRRSHSGDGQVC